jgi:hypothetical protein
MNLIGRDGRTDGRDGRTDAQTTLFAVMATNAKEEWKDHGWWIMVEEVEKSMLWITDHAVLEGRH